MPENHCALNVALYGRGARRWAMTERGAASLHRDSENLQIGPSSLHWNGTDLTVHIAETTAPFPRPVRGTVRLMPPGLATREVKLGGTGKHLWSPIAPIARIEVCLQNPSLTWHGMAYFDTNSGGEPLEEGFLGWHWSRAKLKNGMAVLYHGQTRDAASFSTALRYNNTNEAEDFEAPPDSPLPRSFWGVQRATKSSSPARLITMLEDTPFYARSVIATDILGESTQAVHESLSLTRFVNPVVQAMLPFKAPRQLF